MAGYHKDKKSNIKWTCLMLVIEHIGQFKGRQYERKDYQSMIPTQGKDLVVTACSCPWQIFIALFAPIHP